MSFFLRLLAMLSMLAILFGCMSQINHWNYYPNTFVFGGLAVLAFCLAISIIEETIRNRQGEKRME